MPLLKVRIKPQLKCSKAADNVPDQIELARSLQYGSTFGLPEFLQFIKEHTDMVHKVPYENWDVIVSVGNTEAWDSTLRTFCSKGTPSWLKSTLSHRPLSQPTDKVSILFQLPWMNSV